MKAKNANYMLGFLAVILFVAALFISACSNNNKSDDPIKVVMDFILLCEAGKMDEAAKLLASKNNVDYFKKFQNKGKDMLFIDYDYKGNDDVLEINLSRKNFDNDIAIVTMQTNYKVQNHKFSKEIILHKENGKWKIYEYPSLYPVKVR